MLFYRVKWQVDFDSGAWVMLRWFVCSGPSLLLYFFISQIFYLSGIVEFGAFFIDGLVFILF